MTSTEMTEGLKLPLRVMLVDDQELIRRGFKMILESSGDIDIVGEAANGAEAVNLARTLMPDLVLMDIRMPLMDGIEATRQILREPATEHTKILVLTTFDLDEYVYEALRAGASGFLLKDTNPDALIEAVFTVARGDALLAPSVTRRLVEKFADGSMGAALAHSKSDDDLAFLTDREIEVLKLVGRGLSNSEIADELFISPATAKTHVARIMAKCDLHDRAQLVVLAYEHGLIVPGQNQPHIHPEV